MNLDKFILDNFQEISQLQTEGREAEAFYLSENLTVQALNSQGLIYCSNKQYQKALECFHFGLKIMPANWLLWSNICHVHSVFENHEPALLAAQKAAFYSDYSQFDPIYNMGVSLNALGRIKEAAKVYESSLSLNPLHPHANYNLGLINLRTGNFKEGWERYEYRFLTNPFTGSFKKRFIQDEWDGRTFKKKKLLIYNEQGVGDFIFYARFLPLVKKLGGHVILEVQEALAPLIGKNLKADEIVTRPNLQWPDPPKSDYCISISSLPKVLKIHDLKQVKSKPYFFAAEKPNPFKSKKTKVGICWIGNKDHARDHTRSMFLNDFKPLADKVQLYGIAKGSGIRYRSSGIIDLSEGIESFPFINLDSQIDNFVDLAHIINHLDLVITVDTSVAHLCGAMGKPVWVLLGKETDWRWMDQETSPWYPSMRLFRNKDTWENLIQEVVKELP